MLRGGMIENNLVVGIPAKDSPRHFGGLVLMGTRRVCIAELRVRFSHPPPKYARHLCSNVRVGCLFLRRRLTAGQQVLILLIVVRIHAPQPV